MGGKTVKRLKSVTTLRPKLTGSQEGRTNIQYDIIGLLPYPELLIAYNQSKIKEVSIVEGQGGLASYNKVYYNVGRLYTPNIVISSKEINGKSDDTLDNKYRLMKK